MSTHKVSVREAREKLRQLLDQVQTGDEIVVLRRGVEVGRLVSPRRKTPPLPDLSALRASIKLKGQPVSREISETRRSSRF